MCISLQPHGLCNLPGSSVHGVLQARILEWAAIPFSSGSSWPGIEPRSPLLQVDSLPSEPPGKPKIRFRRHQTGFLLKLTTFKPLPLENISHNPYIVILFGGNAKDYNPGRQYLSSSEKIVPSRQEMGSGYIQVCIKGDRQSEHQRLLLSSLWFFFKPKTRYQAKECCVHASLRAHWICSFQKHLSYLGPNPVSWLLTSLIPCSS